MRGGGCSLTLVSVSSNLYDHNPMYACANIVGPCLDCRELGWHGNSPLCPSRCLHKDICHGSIILLQLICVTSQSLICHLGIYNHVLSLISTSVFECHFHSLPFIVSFNSGYPCSLHPVSRWWVLRFLVSMSQYWHLSMPSSLGVSLTDRDLISVSRPTNSESTYFCSSS